MDPAGSLGSENSAKGKNGILTNRGAIVDTWLEVKGKAYAEARLSFDTRNANLYAPDGALPLTVASDEALALRVVTPDAGYELERFAVRHGRELDGPSIVGGTPQWTETEFIPAADGRITLPAAVMQGDVRIIAHYVPGQNAKYLPAFADEFDRPDGRSPTPNLVAHRPPQSHLGPFPLRFAPHGLRAERRIGVPRHGHARFPQGQGRTKGLHHRRGAK